MGAFSCMIQATCNACRTPGFPRTDASHKATCAYAFQHLSSNMVVLKYIASWYSDQTFSIPGNPSIRKLAGGITSSPHTAPMYDHATTTIRNCPHGMPSSHISLALVQMQSVDPQQLHQLGCTWQGEEPLAAQPSTPPTKTSTTTQQCGRHHSPLVLLSMKEQCCSANMCE